jgi:hypothetical protein
MGGTMDRESTPLAPGIVRPAPVATIHHGMDPGTTTRRPSPESTSSAVELRTAVPRIIHTWMSGAVAGYAPPYASARFAASASNCSWYSRE